MRSLFVVAGVLLMAGALAGGCLTTFTAVVSFEPPHPEWSASLAAPPESRGPRPMPAGEHIVWVTQAGPGQCTLEVRRGDGSLVGRDEGDEQHECSVDGRAEPGELWTMNATSTSAAATVYAGSNPSLLPPPARAVLAGWLALFALGAVLFRRARSAGRAPAAGSLPGDAPAPRSAAGRRPGRSGHEVPYVDGNVLDAERRGRASDQVNGEVV